MKVVQFKLEMGVGGGERVMHYIFKILKAPVYTCFGKGAEEQIKLVESRIARRIVGPSAKV